MVEGRPEGRGSDGVRPTSDLQRTRGAGEVGLKSDLQRAPGWGGQGSGPSESRARCRFALTHYERRSCLSPTWHPYSSIRGWSMTTRPCRALRRDAHGRGRGAPALAVRSRCPAHAGAERHRGALARGDAHGPRQRRHLQSQRRRRGHVPPLGAGPAAAAHPQRGMGRARARTDAAGRAVQSDPARSLRAPQADPQRPACRPS